MTKDKIEAAPKKKGKLKKLLLIGVGAIILIGAGAGAGIYFGALSAHEAKPEDHYPKLVERSTKNEAPAAEGESEEAPLKVGTVSVPNDKYKVDPRKYEITYYPIRSVVLMVLAEQDPALLSTSQGKQRLQRQLTAAINDVLRDKEGFGGIDNVYFTSLVIQ